MEEGRVQFLLGATSADTLTQPCLLLAFKLINLKLNIRYRQNNCYELCNQIHSSIEKCKENCPLECETISYSTDFISITYNPSQERFDKNKASIATQNNISNLSDSELKSRMLSFYIYFEHLKFTEITQIPKTTVSDLISAIGGSLSLFLGISLLSFIEILEFLYEAYYTC